MQSQRIPRKKKNIVILKFKLFILIIMMIIMTMEKIVTGATHEKPKNWKLLTGRNNTQ